MKADVHTRLRNIDPVPDPRAIVDPAARDELLAQLGADDAPAQLAPARRIPRWLTAVAGAAVIAVAIFTGIGSRGDGPAPTPSLGVLSAFATGVTDPDKILHVAEVDVTLDRRGRRRGRAHHEESWSLLSDTRVQRYRIGTGSRAEQGATRADGRIFAFPDKRGRVVTFVQPGPHGDAEPAPELPVQRLAREIASGKLKVAERLTLDGRAAVRVDKDGISYFIAEDAPVLLRQERRTPRGYVQRSTFTAFELLDATPENRKLLDVQVREGTPIREISPP